MTPERGEEIYQEGARAEYNKHISDYSPVNQRKVTLAGYQSLIDAVRQETDKEWAMKLLIKVAEDSK